MNIMLVSANRAYQGDWSEEGNCARKKVILGPVP